MNIQDLMNIFAGAIIGAIVTHLSTNKSNKLSHQMQLREKYYEKISQPIYNLKDYLDISSANIRVYNANKENNIPVIFETSDLNNKMFALNRQNSSQVSIFGNLYDIEKYEYNKIEDALIALQKAEFYIIHHQDDPISYPYTKKVMLQKIVAAVQISDEATEYLLSLSKQMYKSIVNDFSS